MLKTVGLIHTRFSQTGGLEKSINKLVPSLLDRNWHINYITAKIEQPVPDGMTVHKIPVIRGTSITRMLSFAYGARKTAQRINLPLVMGFGRTIYQDIYCDGSGCFLDYQSHTVKRFNILYKTSYLHLERKRYNDHHLQKVIAISHMVKEQIIHRYHLSPEKIEVVYIGVDHDQFNPRFKEKKITFKKQLGIPEDALTLLFIGNEFERKGLQYLIQAFGIVVLESLCSRTPVITGPQLGAGELIDHGINGFVVSNYRPETLADVILKFYYSEKKEKMAANAYRSASAYRWNYHMDAIERVFLDVLS